VPDGFAAFDWGARPEVWTALALSVAIAALFVRSRANQLRLPKLRPVAPGGTAPDCMVVIPARNEERLIGRAVRSLPDDSVIVVDDHSTDGTAEEARKAGAGVIQTSDVPRGAFGKSYACITGARALTSRWILFTDADTHYAPGFLDAAVACADASGIAFLSIYLDPEYPTVGASVLAPYLTALFFCGAHAASGSGEAFNGQCLLVRREAYEFVGGHSAVVNHLNDDVRLAMLAQRHRLAIGIARANRLGWVQFRDLRGTVRRGACRFMIGSPMGGWAILAAAVAMAAWPPVLWGLFSAQEYRPATALAVLPFLLLWRWYGRGAKMLAALALPVAVYLALPLLAGGLWAAVAGENKMGHE
jgi:glycosyltransferase involved in cell wall biosynthesis